MIIRKNKEEFIVINDSSIRDYYDKPQTIPDEIRIITKKQLNDDITQINSEIAQLQAKKTVLVSLRTEINSLLDK